MDFLARSRLQMGEKAIEKLNNSRVAVFGLGGVGGYVLECLVRGGIGEIDIIDYDTVSVSNINRQIIALATNIGEKKTDVAEIHAKSINPNIKINKHDLFLLPENADSFDFSQFDYVVDCMDTVTAKLLLAEKCNQCSTPLISVMGTGNKTNATAFEVDDIFNTTVCPLAKIMRKELKNRNINSLKVVYSKEEPIKINIFDENSAKKSPIISSNSFVPAVAGLIAGGEVIKDLIKVIT